MNAKEAKAIAEKRRQEDQKATLEVMPEILKKILADIRIAATSGFVEMELRFSSSQVQDSQFAETWLFEKLTNLGYVIRTPYSYASMYPIICW